MKWRKKMVQAGTIRISAAYPVRQLVLQTNRAYWKSSWSSKEVGFAEVFVPLGGNDRSPFILDEYVKDIMMTLESCTCRHQEHAAQSVRSTIWLHREWIDFGGASCLCGIWHKHSFHPPVGDLLAKQRKLLSRRNLATYLPRWALRPSMEHDLPVTTIKLPSRAAVALAFISEKRMIWIRRGYVMVLANRIQVYILLLID